MQGVAELNTAQWQGANTTRSAYRPKDDSLGKQSTHVAWV